MGRHGGQLEAARNTTALSLTGSAYSNSTDERPVPLPDSSKPEAM
jgi:hypothetical protein